MSSTLLLFDVDATLLVTGGAGLRAMKRVGLELFDGHWTWESIPVAGRLDPQIYFDLARHNAVGNPAEQHARFHDLYIQYLEDELTAGASEVRSLPGVLETLGLLRTRRETHGDVVLGLLTGNYTRAVPLKVAAAGIDPGWFTVTAFGDQADTRPDLVALAMDRHTRTTGQPIEPKRVVVIGDTPLDVACARAHGCTAFAVATGSYSVQELRDAGADRVVPDLADPAPLLTLVDDLMNRPMTA